MPLEWFPDWSGQVATVIACGESASKDAVDQVRGRGRTIAVNNAHHLAPWADVLYAADDRWWRAYPQASLFPGLKITAHERMARSLRIRDVRVLSEKLPSAHELMIASPGIIGNGGNGGFQAINLALQFGARRIILIGFDMCGDHWHDRHPWPLRNPRAHTLEKWRGYLDAQADVLQRMGAELVNVSERSALTAFPKMPIAEALIRWGVNDRGKDMGFDRVCDRDAAVRAA